MPCCGKPARKLVCLAARARDAYVMNSGSAAYTFASLPAGDPAAAFATVLYACVRDSYGASNCTTTSVTVGPPPCPNPTQAPATCAR